MRALAWLLCVFGLVAIAVALAPAALLDAGLAAQTHGMARLADAHGTVWRGSGTVAAADGTWRLPLAWSVHASPLLRGVVQVDLRPPREGNLPAGVITIDRSHMEWRDLRATLPAAALQTFLKTPNPVALGGEVVVESPDLRWDGSTGAGAADLHWQHASAGIDALRLDLGSVSAHVAVDGPQLTGAFDNAGGDVALFGKGTWSAHAIAVEANLRPTPNAPPWIGAALATFGTPDAQGNVHVTWRAAP